MMIAPGIKDILREYDNSNTGKREGVIEKMSDAFMTAADYFVPSERVKVIVNGDVVAIARNEEDGRAAFKAARLAYNADGIKPVYVETAYEAIDKEKESDKALLKEMKTLKGDELSAAIASCFDKYAASGKKLAYTMRIDDYTVTMEHFEDIVATLEAVQGTYDVDNEFQVGLKKPASNNVTMYEVEVNKKAAEKTAEDGTVEEGAVEQEGAATEGAAEEGTATEGTVEQEGAATEGAASEEGAVTDTSGDEKKEEKDPAVAQAEAQLGAEDGVKYIGFSDRISVVETYVNASEIKDKNEVLAQITTPCDEPGIYVVVPGDCLSIISEKVNMPIDKIKELNEGIEDDDDIYYDDRLNILVPTSPVQVMVEKQETYTEKYYADVEYQDDGSMYIGETSVIQEGSPGTHTVTDLVTYKGELESDRKQLNEVVEVAAVAEVVLRGTKSKPTYMFPVTNWNVTSNFGYRWGRLHAGTDVGIPVGTTVRASRAGQVVTAGWVGGYGNCVIIDHGDGVCTRYGHLSQVLVSVGQYVDQGEQIALSGNTGRSTGPHLHFEIRVNGEPIDPSTYLYQ